MWLILIKLAWRNIFRNKRRTLIASIAIGIGLAALIFVDALMIGMAENMVRTATASFLGDAQIHREGFRDVQEVSLTIQALDEVTTGLAQEEIVEHFTQRVLASGHGYVSSECQRNCPCRGSSADREILVPN